MIEVESLRCRYGDEDVLKGISLRLEQRDMVGILGPNGSGKTTLLHAMSGIVPAHAGSVCIDGHETKSESARWIAKKIASVPQRPEISFSFKCLSVVLMGRYPHLDGWGNYGSDDLDIALTAMEELHISHLAHRPIREVSGGEAQMVIIARAMAQETEIVLLDEATSSLDVARKIHVFDLLTRKNAEGTMFVCTMHDLNLASLYCTRLIFIKSGEIVADGNTEDVFNDTTLSKIYETDVRVVSHPVTGSPQAHFVPGQDTCDARDCRALSRMPRARASHR